MPSIKKRVTGFIRQFSAPNNVNNEAGTRQTGNENKQSLKKPEIKVTSATITDEAFHKKAGCFIQKYLNGESHTSGPDIFSGKTGHDLPVYKVVRDLDPEVFATFTGPDGGLTSISKLEDKLNASMQEADDSEDFDFIDVEDVVSSRQRRPSSTDEPSPLESGIVNFDFPSSSIVGPK